MSRAERLLELLQSLRRHRVPVSGAVLAGEVGVSLRTLYRDIAALQAQGARIEGEAGVGYVLRPGYLLPPLMLSVEEIEALVLGARWVGKHGDVRLGAAAGDLLAKVGAVLPADLRHELESSALLVGPATPLAADDAMMVEMRQAIRRERKLHIAYRNPEGVVSSRQIWPFALGYFEQVRVLCAWCELRTEFRHFRTDRIVELTVTEERYPERRQVLLKAWRLQKGIPSP